MATPSSTSETGRTKSDPTFLQLQRGLAAFAAIMVAIGVGAFAAGGVNAPLSPVAFVAYVFAAFGLLVAWARYRIDARPLERTVELVAYGFVATIGATAFILPSEAARLGDGAVFAGVIGLPFLRDQSLRRLCATAWFTTVATVALSFVLPWGPPSPLDVAHVLGVGPSTLVAGLLLVMLYEFRRGFDKQAGALEQNLRDTESRAHRIAEELTMTLVRQTKALEDAQELGRLGSWTWDADSGRVKWSKEMYRLYDRDERTFHPSYETYLNTIHAEDRGTVEAILANAMRDHVPFSVEYRIQRPGGTVIIVHTRGHVNFDAMGRACGLRGTTQDVSEVRHAQMERQILAEQNRLRLHFINSAAHDLNTPLTPIKLRIATMQKAWNLTESQRAELDSVARNVDRLAALVQDMLDASRLQSGKTQLRQERVDLAQIVADAVASFQPVAESAHVTLGLSMPKELFCQCDPGRVHQVLANLLSNAVKFTPHGGQVSVLLVEEPTTIGLEIIDTGLGMTEAQLARVFQPFERVHEGVAPQIKGTGLGLYLCRGLIEAHGGRIHVASPGPGRGTKVRIVLPKASQEVLRGQPEPAPERRGGHPQRALS
ncbi:MAG: sensor histidine kinase [Thermoplasmatota archaeon]